MSMPNTASLLAGVRALIAEHQMINPGGLVVVAVSGGPDSLCLLHVLNTLSDALGIQLHVAHLDHMLRGAESAAEAAFVADLARDWNLPATIEARDVGSLARAQRINLHAAARTARYAFLAQVARGLQAQAVAVAHHANDQAETVLLHLLRGAGLAGLRGMRPVAGWSEWATAGDDPAAATPNPLFEPNRPPLIRPLLTTTRDAIEQYCTTHDLPARRDPSNLDLQHTRNRIRHDLLPQLTSYNPQVVEALGRTARMCAGDYDFIRQTLAALWPQLARARTAAIDFDGAIWRQLHPALQREALRQGHALLASADTLGMEHVERARALIEQGVGKRIELPGGITLSVGYNSSFTIGAISVEGPQIAQDEMPLAIPGRVALAHGWTLEARYNPERTPGPVSAWQVYLDAAALTEPLYVRGRRPGDRYRPAGGPGSRRMQDVLVDAKIPRALRDRWPLVATRQTIVWVTGLPAAQGFAATPATQQVIQIQVLSAHVLQNEG